MIPFGQFLSPITATIQIVPMRKGFPLAVRGRAGVFIGAVLLLIVAIATRTLWTGNFGA
jgi:hypothetical protein